eukprot:1807375-Amphidinium_carterae.1
MICFLVSLASVAQILRVPVACHGMPSGKKTDISASGVMLSYHNIVVTDMQKCVDTHFCTVACMHLQMHLASVCLAEIQAHCKYMPKWHAVIASSLRAQMQLHMKRRQT